MELKLLRNQRKASFWGQVFPYLPYVLQSGVAVLLLLFLIAFSAWYTTFLQAIPENLPVRWLMLALLGPLTVYSSFRTYMRPADIIFLLPQEAQMKEYLAPAYFSGIIYKLIGLYLVTLTAWPMYIRSGEAVLPIWVMLLVLLGLKCLSAYGAWQELRITTQRVRHGYRLLRWSLILLMLAAWIWQPIWWKSLLFTLLLTINYILALRFPMKHRVAWDNMIANEKLGAAKVKMILGWFVEVPSEGQKVVRRRWLSAVGNGLSWSLPYAYRYLLIKSFVRSELFGMVLRLLVLGMLVVWWTGDSWIAIAVLMFFVFVIGTQLTALRRVHEDSPAASYYPIMANTRIAEALRLISRLLLFVALLLWLPLLAASWGNWLVAFGGLAGGLLLTLILCSSWKRKWKQEDEED